MVKKRYVSDIACAWLIGARDSRMNQLIDSNLDIYLQLVCRYALPLVLPGFVFSGQRNWGHANHMQCHDWEHYQVHEITLWRWSSPQKVQVGVQGNLMFRFYFSFFSQHQEAIIRTENLALKTELARHNEALVEKVFGFLLCILCIFLLQRKRHSRWRYLNIWMKCAQPKIVQCNTKKRYGSHQLFCRLSHLSQASSRYEENQELSSRIRDFQQILQTMPPPMSKYCSHCGRIVCACTQKCL